MVKKVPVAELLQPFLVGVTLLSVSCVLVGLLLMLTFGAKQELLYTIGIGAMFIIICITAIKKLASLKGDSQPIPD